MKRLLLLFCVLFVNLSGQSQNYILHSNIPYDNIPGVAPNLLSLDVYEPLNLTEPRPVVIYVHGGSWKGGSKLNVSFKADLFTEHNYVFVSVNYRLSPDPPDTSSTLVDAVRFPIHPIDVAKAVSAVYQQIHLFNGDNQNIHLIGHSAGAHLINLITTNQAFLEPHSLSPEDIRCVCSLDAGVFDLSFEIEVADASRRLMLLSAFGTDSTLYEQASPLFNIGVDEDLPDFLLIHQGTPQRILKTVGFRDSLLVKGHSGVTFNAFPYSHSQINTGLGAPDDSIGMTDLVIDFFENCSNPVTTLNDLTTEQLNLDFQIFPNPSSGAVSFKGGKIREIIVINLLGQEVLTEKVRNNRIYLGNLPKGAYWLRAFLSEEISFTRKVILR